MRNYIAGSNYGKSKKYVRKHICFDESKCKSEPEIDQDKPASSASQVAEPDLKEGENKVLSARVFQNVFRNISLLLQASFVSKQIQYKI